MNKFIHIEKNKLFIILKYSRWTCMNTNKYIRIGATKNQSNIVNIATYWSIAKLLQIIKVLQNLKSIAISITKFQKYGNKYCKFPKVLQ